VVGDFRQREQNQRDLKDQITQFFNWFQYELSEGLDGTPAPSCIPDYEENYESDIRGGDVGKKRKSKRKSRKSKRKSRKSRKSKRK